jgi:hypothetical protein
LIVSASNSQWDAFKLEQTWDGKWSSAVHRGDDRWTVEMTVPLSELGVTGEAGLWRLNIARFHRIFRQWSTWAPMKGGLHQSGRFGVMRVKRE